MPYWQAGKFVGYLVYIFVILLHTFIKMKDPLYKGILNSLAFYGVGLICAIIVHFIFGWKYAHAPPLSSAETAMPV